MHLVSQLNRESLVVALTSSILVFTHASQTISDRSFVILVGSPNLDSDGTAVVPISNAFYRMMLGNMDRLDPRTRRTMHVPNISASTSSQIGHILVNQGGIDL
jgi:hypothetical protein